MSVQTDRNYRRDGVLGAYQASHLSGTMAAALTGDSEIFQFRWTDTTRSCLIHSVTLDGLAGSATAFAAGFAKVNLAIARAWTAVGSGGTGMTLTGDNQALRTSMPVPLVGDIRGASTAALTAGTKTIDAQPVGQFAFTIGTVVSAIYVPTPIALFDEQFGAHPIILATNEGLVIRATVPATGTWQFGVTVRWSEVTSY